MSRYIEEHRGRFGVEPICRTLGVSASAYYQRARVTTTHARNHFAYGYRRMWKALLRAGEQVSRRADLRLNARAVFGSPVAAPPVRPLEIGDAPSSALRLVDHVSWAAGDLDPTLSGYGAEETPEISRDDRGRKD